MTRICDNNSYGSAQQERSVRLLRVFNEVLANKRQPHLAGLDSEMRLREDIGFDSLDLAELTVRIEEAFEVDVFADGVVRTVGEIEAKISSH